MPYADYTEFTRQYSLSGISQVEIESAWLPYGKNRVDEALGGAFTTPFSNNNSTAKYLNIDYAYLGILLKTRDPDDSRELLESLTRRITDIVCNNKPMVLSTGESVFPDRAISAEFWSNTQAYKSVFDMRDAREQRVDPDYIWELRNADN